MNFKHLPSKEKQTKICFPVLVPSKDKQLIKPLSSKENQLIKSVPSKEKQLIKSVLSKENQLIKQVSSKEKQLIKPISSKEKQLIKPVLSKETQLIKPVLSIDKQLIKPVSSKENQLIKPVSSKENQLIRPVSSKENQLIKPISSKENQLIKPVSSKENQLIKPVSSKLLPNLNSQISNKGTKEKKPAKKKDIGKPVPSKSKHLKIGLPSPVSSKNKQLTNLKIELSKSLYQLYNSECFDGILPKDMAMNWNDKLRKTAGRCFPRKHIDRKGVEHRSSRIEFSSKVIDSCSRLRETLIHEMCHSAAWITSGYRDGHGPLWKSWATRAMLRFPDLPVIDRCHGYAIRTKYTYKCEQCGYSVGRHSKSLNTARKVCGHCHGVFQLVVNYKGKEKGWRCSLGGENTPCTVCHGKALEF